MLTNWLNARITASPNALAYPSHTFADMYQYARHIEAQLIDTFGDLDGKHIVILMPNQIHSVATIYALIHSRAVLVPINTRLTADEVAYQLQNADCVGIIYDEHYADLIADSDLPKIAINGLPELTTHYANISNHAGNPDDILAIIHTSGTSGKPKGATLTYNNIFMSAVASAYRIGTQSDDNWLCILPLYHVGGLSIVLRSLLYGTQVTLLERFDVDTVNDMLTNQPITLVSLVPTMLYRLLEKRTQTWQTRLVLLGGAAPSQELVEQCIAENIPIATTYGLSEASSQVATALNDTVTQKPNSVGKPLIFTSVRIADENGDDVPTDEYGEVVVSGQTVMQGYYGNDEATQRTIKNGELYTGDIGYLDADGDLHLVQRRSDLIVTGGENVYPAEVEAVLRQHTSVKSIAVVGISHPEWGQQVACAIVLINDVTISTDEIQTFAREHLAGYKIPRQILFVDALPQTASGKIERKRVRALFGDTG